ncbi:cyclin-domain-containing protein [Schizophyllum commune Tattone D]|nr:cyclin-domain-containing protein [Schizophyllum commune Tattone D]
MQQSAPRVDIHSLPSAELLSLLAQLLTNIASANDELGASGLDASHHAADHHRAPVWNTLTTASRAALSTPSSTLTFHARNIPTISLEAYLVRILKYCPTTNEVFLSLLVYFDRMSKLSLEATGRTFVIDSYNIHRLVIAGVTVASKFFSDVFYTNSRYAKVGGLPLTELNQLELQFLLLNNFSLVIHQDEMQRYAEQLILFSHKHSSSPLPHTIVPLSSIPSSSQTGSAAPTPAMGAVDAYGGQIPTHPSSATSHANHEQAPSSVSAAFQPRYSSGDDTETETETETETDGGSTTDDEPTIRPAHSSAGSVSDDSSSLYSTSTTSEDADEADEIMDGDAIREMDIVEDSDGGRTPDVRKFFGGSTPPRMRHGDDSQMASP